MAAQLRIAAGEPVGFSQDDLHPRGHAIQCRINAEDPARGFDPGPGTIQSYAEPAGLGIRVDSGYGPKDVVPDAYDGLVAKLVAWAPTREETRKRMLRTLDEFVIEGIPTTLTAHRVMLRHQAFVDGTYSTRTLEDKRVLEGLVPGTEEPDRAVLLVQGRPVRLWHPAMAAQAAGSTSRGRGSGAVTAPMHATVLRVLVRPGDQVQPGAPVAVVEAMKMETAVPAPIGGSVEAVHVKEGDVVEAGDVLADLS